MCALSQRSILIDGKLVGDNFLDWYRNLRIVLMQEKIIDTIDKPSVSKPESSSTYKKYLEDCMNAKCVILASMSSELQRQHKDMDPPGIVDHVKKMYGSQSKTTRYQLSKTLLGPH
ncbi:hypothetical protein Fmac_026738 [Flemingia macrophylla]|uniref:Uncharacterized protein n=1 Tax=Flemingia macrophylla TaxID=520843 RepID=A0ABD1LFQ9_9FABA